MEMFIAGLLTAQYISALIQIVFDTHFVFTNRRYTGPQLMALVMLLIPFAPVFVLVHITMDKFERFILPKQWIFKPKMKKL